jgi:hypothetical protein
MNASGSRKLDSALRWRKKSVGESMRNRSVIAGAALASIAVSAWFAGAQAQPSLPGSTWASIQALPDWSGLWEVTFAPGISNEQPALTPAFDARFEAYRAAERSGEIQDSPAANCVPNGMPGIMTQPYPIEILFTPGKVTILIEAYAQWRQIFTDGRRHPDDPDLTFNGHSIGHWEGETLVVDTVGLRPTPRSAAVSAFVTARRCARSSGCASSGRIRSRS